MSTLLPHLPLVLATFLVAGLVKGVVGLGLPTVAMGLLGSVMPPAEAAALLLVPSLATNVWQAVSGPRLGALARRLAGLMAGVVLGTMAGSGLMAGHSGLASAALGCALVAYAGAALLKVRLRVPPRARPWAGPLVGAATGLVTGATGVFVIPVVPYLAALELERDELVQALALSFTASTLALAAGLAWHGLLAPEGLAAAPATLLPALAGMALGTRMRRRVSEEAFRRWLFVALLGLGAEIAARALA